MIRSIALALAVTACAHAATLAASSVRGAQLFESLSCAECHTVNGKGGRTAPDLGRVVDRSFTPAALASTMWNHAPTMWGSMRVREIRAGELNEQAAADLFAYFYSARFFEKPGDAGRGKRLFAERGCTKCHGLTQMDRSGAPPVSVWQTLTDPIALAAAMWNHAPRMLAEAKEKRVKWPQIAGQDLTDLLVYLRNLPGTRQKPGAFQTSAGSGGEALFRTKGCAGCHEFGPLAHKIRGRTLTEIAAEMWDHAPRMSVAMRSAMPQLDAGEMRELLSYVWARQFFENAGDAVRGKRVFAAKHCGACHDSASSGAPDLTAGQRSFTGAAMVSALWSHGPNMLNQMKTKSIPWPRFEATEMSDVIAFLNAPEGRK